MPVSEVPAESADSTRATEAAEPKVTLREEEIQEIKDKAGDVVFYSDFKEEDEDKDEDKDEPLVNVIDGVKKISNEGVEIELAPADKEKGEKAEKVVLKYEDFENLANEGEAERLSKETKRAVIRMCIFGSKGGGAKKRNNKRSARGRGAGGRGVVAARKTLRRTRRRVKRGGAPDTVRRYVMVILNYEKVKKTLNSEGEAGDRMREQMMRDIQEEVAKIAAKDGWSGIQIQFSSEVNRLLNERNLLDELKRRVAGGKLRVRGPPDDENKRKILEEVQNSAVEQAKRGAEQKMSDDKILENTLDEYTDMEMQKYKRMRKRKEVGSPEKGPIANRVKELKVREQMLGGFKFGTYTFTAAVSAFSGIIFALLFNPII